VKNDTLEQIEKITELAEAGKPEDLNAYLDRIQYLANLKLFRDGKTPSPVTLPGPTPGDPIIAPPPPCPSCPP
jgi:hypothetical protein